MKILWLCNFPLQKIADSIGIPSTANEGWIQGLSSSITQDENIQLVFLFPQRKSLSLIEGVCEKIKYYGFYQKSLNPSVLDEDLHTIFKNIIVEENPNVIHLMGTEFSHSLSMITAVKEAGMLDRTVASIQGITAICAKHYLDGIPQSIIKRITLADAYKRYSLTQQQKIMEARGKTEVEVVKLLKNIIGRTEFDKAFIGQTNPNCRYFHGGEILREPFYTDEWKLEEAERHSVFISQATYPVKGFHYALEGLGMLAKKYDDLKVYVAGGNITDCPKWKQPSYTKYILDLIESNGLRDKIIFTGTLYSQEMKQRFLKSHVFLSASVIENSPNSLGEAMLLGMPCVSSAVGGVSSMMLHEQEGFLYQANAPYMMAHYIDRIFSDDELAVEIGQKSKARAQLNHSKELIIKETLQTYETIAAK